MFVVSDLDYFLENCSNLYVYLCFVMLCCLKIKERVFFLLILESWRWDGVVLVVVSKASG